MACFWMGRRGVWKGFEVRDIRKLTQIPVAPRSLGDPVESLLLRCAKQHRDQVRLMGPGFLMKTCEDLRVFTRQAPRRRPVLPGGPGLDDVWGFGSLPQA